MNNKKGQLTLFMLLGIILLIGVMLIIYLNNQETESILEPETTMSTTPEFAVGVRKFVTDCIQKISIEGFKKIGLQGGYIDMLDFDLSGRLFTFSGNPTESDGVLFSSGGFHPVPYWFYLVDRNDCSQCGTGSVNPGISLYLQNFHDFFDAGLEAMEGQMDKYVDKELKKCLNDFAPWRIQAYNFTYADVLTTTKIADHDVTLTVDFPVTVNRGTQSAELTTFVKKLDLKLKDIYELATITALYQINYQFLENISLYLIDRNSIPIGANKMPPRTYSDHEFSTVNWYLPQVRQRFEQNILLSKIHEIDVDKTKDARRGISPNADVYEQGIYDLLFQEYLIEAYPTLDISFIYSRSWGDIYFDIYPKTSGTRLEPDVDRSGGNSLINVPMEQTNNYEFFYDISYPVIVKIRDNSSLLQQGEQGYTFRFALEANIRANRNLLQCNTGTCGLAPHNYNSVTGNFGATGSTSTPCIPGPEAWLCNRNCGPLPFFPQHAGSVYATKAACGSQCCGGQSSCDFTGHASYSCPLTGDTFSNEPQCANDCSSNPTPVTVDISSVPSVACDPELRIYDNITIITRNATAAGEPLADVALNWGCGHAWDCSFDKTNEQGTYNTRLTYCNGQGHLFFEKAGYLPKFHTPISATNPNAVYDLEVTLEPIRSVPVDAYFLNVTNLFRIKKELYHTTGSSIIDTLYHELSSGFSGIDEEGVLIDIIEEIKQEFINPSFFPGVPPGIKPEGTALIAKLAPLKLELKNARNLISTYGYWHDMNRDNVVEAAHKTMKALEVMYNIVNNPAYVNNTIRSHWLPVVPTYTLPPQYWNINIPTSISNKLNTHYLFLKREMKNIVFLTAAQRADPATIADYRGRATPLRQHQQLIISNDKIKDDPNEHQMIVTQAFHIEGGDAKLDLVPGRYNVNGIFRDSNPYTIPSRGFLPEQDYTGGTFGGFAISNTENRNWIVQTEPLDAAKKVKFYFFNVERWGALDELQGEAGDFAWYSNRFRNFIDPELIT